MDPYAPLQFNHCKNSADANDAIVKLLWGGSDGITILPLVECDPELFAAVRDEAMEVRNTQAGQVLDASHRTTAYIQKQDKSWKVKENSVHQYSLYNSKDDFLYNDDDHRWSEVERQFNSRLQHIPKFVETYFGKSELQNFRLQSLTKEGSLGLHREKIIGIPGRENHYKVRFHLPIVTNPNVVFYMDAQEHKMKEGQIYLFNQSSLHGVNNAGEALRVHLVWDCYLNEHIVQKLIKPALGVGV